jgi:hypothetical protein
MEAVLASGASINASLAAKFSTVDGADLFTNILNKVLAPAVVTAVGWNVIPDKPIVFYQLELLSPSVGIYGLDGSLDVNFLVPNTYVDGSVSLTFSSIAIGSIPLVHTYTVPFVSYTSTEFRTVVETKYHPTAPIDDGTYNVFVNYTMRKYTQPRNATLQLVIDFDDCADVAAACNNGTCVNGENSFSCACDDGFSGAFCQTNVDDCLGVVCQNGALCQDSVADYTCICPPNYFGKNCDARYNACAANACVNGAECVVSDASAVGYVCECPKGFVGPYCGNDVNECATDPCLNGGTCEDLVARYNCLCQTGWEGKQCESNPNDCILVTEPCENGGSCIDRVGGFQCACTAGWSGIDCAVDVDECLSFPCENGGTCSQGLGFFGCACVEGFEGNVVLVHSSRRYYNVFFCTLSRTQTRTNTHT